MRVFWVAIEVHLAEPMALVGDGGAEERAELRGFVQELGCTAEDRAAAEEIVRAHVAGYELGPGQKTDVIFSHIEELDPSEAPEGATGATGVWFATGRSFYSED
jgi:hypothetical protein